MDQLGVEVSQPRRRVYTTGRLLALALEERAEHERDHHDDDQVDGGDDKRHEHKRSILLHAGVVNRKSPDPTQGPGLMP